MGMLYIAGITTGAFSSFSNAGGRDAFIQKWNPFPPQFPVPPSPIVLEWTDQFGTIGYDFAFDLDLDATGIYAVGKTFGDLSDGSGQLGSNMFVRKVDAIGTPLWTHQDDTGSGANGITCADDGVYLCGEATGYEPNDPNSFHLICFIGKFCADPEITASPSSHDLGDIDVWDTVIFEVEIGKNGVLPLIIEDIALSSTVNGYFSVESTPSLPLTLDHGSTAVVEMSYHPWETGKHATVLNIDSNDPDGALEVEISATAVASEDPPDEQMEKTEEFIEDEIEDGGIVGTGDGESADNRLSAFLDKIAEAIASYEEGDVEDAIGTLQALLKKCDGDPKPPDHVEGDAAVELAERIMDLIEMMEGEL